MLIGFVGKPSTGKSTFFKAITLADVGIASYPFTTIKPNTGAGYVRVKCVDKEFGVQCNPRMGFCTKGTRFVPVELIDVAGLVPGAHMGLGMGNAFLDDLRQADALVHIVDASGGTNEKGESVPIGSYNPENDVLFLEEELDLWYFGILKNAWPKFIRLAQAEASIKKAIANQFSGLGGVKEDIIEELLEKLGLTEKKIGNWSEEDILNFAKAVRKRTKKTIIACNKIDAKGAYDNYLRLKEKFKEHIFVPCSAESELALREAAKQKLIEYVPGDNNFKIIDEGKLTDKQKAALKFIKENILDKYGSTGVQETLDRAVFELLQYIAIFPGGVNNLVDKHGNVLPDCFLLPKGSTPVDFAYKIHSDIGDHYVKAINVKTKLPLAKEYALQNTDVIEIKTSK